VRGDLRSTASDQDFVEPAFQFAAGCSYTVRVAGSGFTARWFGRGGEAAGQFFPGSSVHGLSRAQRTTQRRGVGYLQGHDARLEHVGENAQDAGIFRRASCDQDWIHVLANPARVQAQTERLCFHHGAGSRKWVVAVDKVADPNQRTTGAGKRGVISGTK